MGCVERRVVVACFAVALGCTLQPDEMGSGFGEGGGEPTSSPTDATSTGAPDEPASTDGGDGSETTAATFDPIDGSSSDGDAGGEASTGAPADTGAQDPGGAYAACQTNDDCGNDSALACLRAEENGASGFCSPACGSYGATPPDASLCPDAPAGVTATIVCLEGLIRNCALSCQDDADCPSDTACLPANGGAGPFCFGI